MKHQSKRNTHLLRLQCWIQLEQQHTHKNKHSFTQKHTPCGLLHVWSDTGYYERRRVILKALEPQHATEEENNNSDTQTHLRDKDMIIINKYFSSEVFHQTAYVIAVDKMFGINIINHYRILNIEEELTMANAHNNNTIEFICVCNVCVCCIMYIVEFSVQTGSWDGLYQIV